MNTMDGYENARRDALCGMSLESLRLKHLVNVDDDYYTSALKYLGNEDGAYGRDVLLGILGVQSNSR